MCRLLVQHRYESIQDKTIAKKVTLDENKFLAHWQIGYTQMIWSCTINVKSVRLLKPFRFIECNLSCFLQTRCDEQDLLGWPHQWTGEAEQATIFLVSTFGYWLVHILVYITRIYFLIDLNDISITPILNSNIIHVMDINHFDTLLKHPKALSIYFRTIGNEIIAN